MAFADPQSLTINAVAKTLPRTGSGTNSGSFAAADGEVKLSISHNPSAKKVRRVARVDYALIAPDPLTAENTEFPMTAYVVVEAPVRGLTILQQKYVVDALAAWLTASTGANVTKLLGGES